MIGRRTFFNLAILLTSMIAGLMVATAPMRVSAGLFDNAKSEACRGIKLDNPADPCADDSRLNSILKAVLNILSVVVGVAAIIMIIIAAMKFVTSQGESSNIASARSTITYAVVGLVIVALSQFIIRFVLKQATTSLPFCPPDQTTLENGKPCLQKSP